MQAHGTTEWDAIGCRQSTACNDTSWVWTPLVVLCCLLEVVSMKTEAMLIPEPLLMLQLCIFLHFSSLSRTSGSIQAGVAIKSGTEQHDQHDMLYAVARDSVRILWAA